ncbi:mitogen-activated protein kinase kinase kinase 2-like [Physella acuta]|uniref:mitogen-activated protein kinase kinase kinase 2-like n=1 Tax=Physella acuta TaxID=109671 RepID=UPI0027DCC40B|nr:mitogen-activated protein kinase kinase kinase 2-like [Physella acuta]
MQKNKVLSDDFPKEFTLEEQIGQGAFGTVHLVIDKCGKYEHKFVAKRIDLKKQENIVIRKREAEILMKIRHRRIVQFHGFQCKTNEILIFLEYLTKGTLASFISRSGKLGEQITRHFTIQILDGVDYLHQNKILHRDIKGNNILMEDDMNIKITDFGISEFIEGEGVSTEIGTVRYMAPEVVYTEGGKIINYTSRADIWSVGCTVIEMLTGKPPNSSVPTPLAIFRTATSEPPHYQLPPSSSVYLQEFVDKVLQRESNQRPTAGWLLKYDPFILGDHCRDDNQGPFN